MKKAIIILLAVAMFLILASCSGGKNAKTAEDIIKAFSDAGIPVTDVAVYNEKTDPNEKLGKPNQYTSKANFNDERIKKETEDNTEKTPDGGTVEVFGNKKDADTRREYLENIYESMPFMSEHIFQKDAILVRVNMSLTAEQAQEYENVLKALD